MRMFIFELVSDRAEVDGELFSTSHVSKHELMISLELLIGDASRLSFELVEAF